MTVQDIGTGGVDGRNFGVLDVALVHGMSRPIGAHFHVPHGLSNAMLLPAVTAFSAGSLARYRPRHGGGEPGRGDQSLVSRRLVELAALNNELEVPTPKNYGIDEAKWNRLLGTMAVQALASVPRNSNQDSR